MKTYKGVKNPKFREIVKNKDEEGRILTYTVKGAIAGQYDLEFNTLGEARVMALIMDGDEE